MVGTGGSQAGELLADKEYIPRGMPADDLIEGCGGDAGESIEGCCSVNDLVGRNGSNQA